MFKTLISLLIVVSVSLSADKYIYGGQLAPNCYHPEFSISTSPNIPLEDRYSTCGGTPYTSRYTVRVPLGWSGTVTPSATGYVFDPPSRGVAPIIQDLFNCNFTVTDTMRPNLIVYNNRTSIEINHEDIINTAVFDNSWHILGYKYYISYNDGLVWNLIKESEQIDMVSNDTIGTAAKTQTPYIPTTLTTNARIRVICYDPHGNYDTVITDKFNIVDTEKPTVTLENPSTINSGDSYNIIWTADDNISVISRALYLGTDNNFVLIDSSNSNIESYTYTFNKSYATDNCKIRIIVYDQSGNSTTITSSSFAVVDDIDPELIITSPLEGMSWTIGETYDIIWSANDNIGVISYKVSFSRDNNSYSLLKSSSGASGSYAFSVVAPTGDGYIKIDVYDAAGNVKTKISGFSIIDGNAPVVTLTSPLTTALINNAFWTTWTSIDDGTITGGSVYFSKDGGNSYYYIDSVAGSSGNVYTVIDDTVQNGRVMVRVYDSDNNCGIVISDSIYIIDNDNPRASIRRISTHDAYSGSSDSLLCGLYDVFGVTKKVIYFSSDSGKTYTVIDSSTAHTLAGQNFSEYIIWTVPSIVANQCCFLKIKAYDAAGNSYEQNYDPYKLFSIIDTTAPSASLITPATVTIGDNTEIGWVCNDNVSFKSVAIFFDDVRIDSLTVPQGHITYPISKAGTIKIKAYDVSGNMAEVEQEIAVREPSDHIAPVIEVSIMDTILRGEALTVKWTCSDNVLFTAVVLYYNDKKMDSVEVSDGEINIDITESGVLRILAYDASGNVTEALYEVTIKEPTNVRHTITMPVKPGIMPLRDALMVKVNTPSIVKVFNLSGRLIMNEQINKTCKIPVKGFGVAVLWTEGSKIVRKF